MHIRIGVALMGLALAGPVYAQSNLEVGFSGAVRGCEEWILNPASWIDGMDPFISATGLGRQMGLVESVNEASLPPRELRVANRYWRINSAKEAGYILVVSDRLPMCHITGGGGVDLQPVVKAVLNSERFQSRWEKLEESLQGEMVTTTYKNREEPALSMVISHADQPGQRIDRVQVIATATIKLGE